MLGGVGAGYEINANSAKPTELLLDWSVAELDKIGV